MHDVEHPVTGAGVPNEPAEVAEEKSAQWRCPGQNLATGRNDVWRGESRPHDGDEQRYQRYPAEKIKGWRGENQYLQNSGEGGKQPMPLADAIHKLSLDDCRSARRGMITVARHSPRA